MSSCGNKRDGISLAVSIPPQYKLLGELTGDSLPIVTIISTDANPETWESTTKTLGILNDADVYFTTGRFPFEASLENTLSSDVEIVDTSKGISMIEGEHCHEHGAKHEHSHSQYDPHIWTSIANMKIMAKTFADKLSEIDPIYADKYSRNLAKINHRLDSLDSVIRAKLVEHSGKSSFLIWHPSLSYFARDYNLSQIPFSSENKELSVNSLREILDHASNAQCAIMFLQSNFDSRQAKTAAAQLNIPTMDINPLDPDWENQLIEISNAIAR